MSDETVDQLQLAYDLDASPEAVWRALSIPELRAAWLPARALSEAEPTVIEPGRALRYRIKDEAPPYRDSVVTFTSDPVAHRKTRLTILQIPLPRASDAPLPVPANRNRPALMRAA